jgi:hypothetical protein
MLAPDPLRPTRRRVDDWTCSCALIPSVPNRLRGPPELPGHHPLHANLRAALVTALGDIGRTQQSYAIPLSPCYFSKLPHPLSFKRSGCSLCAKCSRYITQAPHRLCLGRLPLSGAGRAGRGALDLPVKPEHAPSCSPGVPDCSNGSRGAPARRGDDAAPNRERGGCPIRRRPHPVGGDRAAGPGPIARCCGRRRACGAPAAAPRAPL